MNIPNKVIIKRGDSEIIFSCPFLTKNYFSFKHSSLSMDLPLYSKKITFEGKNLNYLDEPMFIFEEKAIKIRYPKQSILFYLEHSEVSKILQIKKLIGKDLILFKNKIETNEEKYLITEDLQYITTTHILQGGQEFSSRYYDCIWYLYKKYSKSGCSNYFEMIEELSKKNFNNCKKVIFGLDSFYQISLKDLVK